VPRFVQDCVVAVAPKRGVRAAFAICYASAKKGGHIRWGSTKLTRKGQRVERSLARRPGAKKRVERFEKVLATARSKRRARPNPWPVVGGPGSKVDAGLSFYAVASDLTIGGQIHARRIAHAGIVLATAALDNLAANGAEDDDQPRLAIEAMARAVKGRWTKETDAAVDDLDRRGRQIGIDTRFMGEDEMRAKMFTVLAFDLAWDCREIARQLKEEGGRGEFARARIILRVQNVAHDAPWAWEAFGESHEASQHIATAILFRALGETQ
jgi:hypothetical protein